MSTVIEPTTPAEPGAPGGEPNQAAMDEIFGAQDTAEPGTPGAEPPKADPVVEPPATEKPAESVPDEGLDLKALEELTKVPEPEKPAGPAIDPFVAKVKSLVGNEENLNLLVDAGSRMYQAQAAAEKGDYQALITALPQLGTVIPSILQQYVAANEEKIVQSYIDRHDPARQQDPRVPQLQQELNGLKQVISSAQQNVNAAREQAAGEQQRQAYLKQLEGINTEVVTFLDKVRFSKDAFDREAVTALFRDAVRNDPQLARKALANPEAIRPLLGQVVTRFSTADKARGTARPPQTSTPPKPILTGAGSATSGQSDLNVYERTEAWMKSLVKR